MRALVALALFVAAVSAAPKTFDNRIIGGSVTTINNYPSIVPLLFSSNWVNFIQDCGATILNQRSLLTAAHCFHDAKNDIRRWMFRVGSSFAHSGGVQHYISQIIIHPSYNRPTIDNDVAVLRSSNNINYINNAVQPASIAGSNYNLGDNQVVWAAGWGVTEFGWPSEQLRHVQVWTINQGVCRQRYGQAAITDNMLCSGWLDVGGRDQCQGDSGGPLYHNGIVVGVTSWGSGCGNAFFPGVNARVSRFTSWIQSNA
ncbi:trypsin, alkaline C-like [Anticarsia gemmatalis]|uniref:trypsin, alkaline C-like n=1 Tax=Anticarsia gemmatalis TaxID=129554 RepID=UPI003F769770